MSLDFLLEFSKYHFIKGATSNYFFIFFHQILPLLYPVKTVPYINNLLKVNTQPGQWQKSIKSADFIVKKCFALAEY